MKSNSEVTIDRTVEGKVLVYYFAFPHYRAGILRALKEALGDKLDLVSGSLSRSGLKPLTEQELPILSVRPTLHLGPVSWDKHVVKPAISAKYSDVVLGPAVLSISTWTILIGRRLLGRRTFLWGQCGQPGVRSTKRVLQEIMNRLATGLLVYGSYEETGAKELGTPSEKVHRVHNSVPMTPIEFSSEQLSEQVNRRVAAARERGELTLVYVGRVNEDKRVDVLLSAGEILQERYGKLSIRIIGEGPEIDSLKSQFPSVNCEFVGGIYSSELLQEEIASASFIIAPMKMGLLAVDALSVGVPAMVPNNPVNGSEFEALTMDVNGFSFDYGNAEDLAHQIESALEKLSKFDAQEYFDSRAKGIHDWSPEMVANNIVGAISGNRTGEER